MKKSLTAKAFYQGLLSLILFLGMLTLISFFSSNNLTSYVVTGYVVSKTIPVSSSSAEPEFIPCPIVFQNQACVRGINSLVEFKPIFKIFNIKDNFLVSTSISFGNQLVCGYESLLGNRYRLTGRISSESTCRALENGFLCKR